MPRPWSTTTVFPEKNNSSASATRPRCAACTGVPVVAGKSTPPCGDPGLPFRIRRFPKFPPVLTPSRGTRNFPFHKRSGVTRSKISRSLCRSSSARLICSGLGSTNSFSTCKLSVANRPFLTAGRLPRHFQVIGSRRFFQVHSHQASLHSFAPGVLPERNASPSPIPLQFRQWLCTLHLHQQQTSLARYRRAQSQGCPRSAIPRFLRHRSNRKQPQRRPKAYRREPHPPRSNWIHASHSYRCCRIAATRDSTLSNCVRATFDPRMAFSIVRNKSGLFIFSRSSVKKGRTFAKIK